LLLSFPLGSPFHGESSPWNQLWATTLTPGNMPTHPLSLLTSFRPFRPEYEYRNISFPPISKPTSARIKCFLLYTRHFPCTYSIQKHIDKLSFNSHYIPSSPIKLALSICPY
jgi:hypothetical protein